MTVIAGFFCKDKVMLACDSQTTAGTTKTCETKKIVPIYFQSQPVLIAQSGNAVLSAHALGIIEKLAANTPISDYRTVADVAAEAILKVKREMMQPYQGMSLGLPDFDQLFWDNQFELMMAYYFKDTPYMFTIDFHMGIANKVGPTAALGCGGPVAAFLMNWLQTHKMKPPTALTAAVYIIEEVKKVDAFCGGPTIVGMVHKEAVCIFANDDIEKIVNKLAKVDPDLKKQAGETLFNAFADIADTIGREPATEPANNE